MVVISILLAALFTACSGVAFVVGLNAVARKCKYRALKIFTGAVAAFCAVFLSGVFPHLSLHQSFTPSMLISAMALVSAFFIGALSLVIRAEEEEGIDLY